MSDIVIFDRKHLIKQRNRVAQQLHHYDFLLKENAHRLIDRLQDTIRDFPVVLELGCHNGFMADLLKSSKSIDHLIQSDISYEMVKKAKERQNLSSLVVDEEYLPFAPNSFDLVISNLALHWVNDLPGCLLQIKRILKPDGLFLASLFGGGTLYELNQSLMNAEIEIHKGISPRISPFTDVKDAGALLQRAGFSLPVVDSDKIEVTYENPLTLLHDLRGMGQANCIMKRQKYFTGRSILFKALSSYQDNFALEDGKVKASFTTINLTGWKDTIQ
jgi:malonyl-ACP O-methyltransferase BioC